MPNPLTIADAADLVDLSIQDIFVKADPPGLDFYKQYYNIDTGVSDYYVKDSSLSTLEDAGRIVEGASVTGSSPLQGYDKTFTQVRFGVLFSVTWEMWNFGLKKRKLEDIVNQAKVAVARKREFLCADRLDNGWSTTYNVNDIGGNYSATITGGNGVALFSASQTREDGGTNNNNIVYDGNKSVVPSLKEIISYLISFRRLMFNF